MKQLTKTIWQTFLLCAMILSLPVALQAQTSSSEDMEGLVVDQAEVPVVGASVVIKGTRTGTVSDENGKFSISISAGEVLEISCIGYQTATVTPSGRQLKVVLQEDTELLDEVVVVGFGTQKKVNLTGPVSAVNMDKVLKNRPIADVGAALQGSMPGLQITTANARPGEAPQFNVRGFTSINGGSPLILVDNVPMDLSMIDPADIESVSVLKDAASAAIYGARAAYGVILVTTKKGQSKDKIQVNYNNNFAFSSPINLPEKGSIRDHLLAEKASGVTTDAILSGDVDTWLGLLDEYNADPAKYPTGYTDVEGVRYRLKEYDLIHDMMDQFGFQHKHNLSLQGISGKNSYRLSFGYVDEDGILYTDKDRFQRYNVSAYWKTEPTKWLDVSADIKYANSARSYVTGSKMPDGGLFSFSVKKPSYWPTEPGKANQDGLIYPRQTARTVLENESPLQGKNQNLRMLGVVNLKPVKGLVITGEYSFMTSGSDIDFYQNQFPYLNQLDNWGTYSNENYFEKKHRGQTFSTLNAFATYSNNIKGHDFSIMAGYNQEVSHTQSMEAKRFDVISSKLPALSQATGELSASDAYSSFSTRSLFYRLNYSYKERYLIETSGRYDGSSKFPKARRFGFFPSGSIAWRLDREKFAQADWFSLGKLRASIGTIGNQSIENYAFLPTMDSYLSPWLINGTQPLTLHSPALVSRDFTWETVLTYDVGVDLRFWDKLSATFDYYMRDTKNMLTEAMQLPSVLGTTAPKENAADLRTKGWELEINWKDNIGDFFYNIGFNLYDSKSVITKFANEVGLLSIDPETGLSKTYNVGHEIGEIWGYETAGLYQPEHFDAEGNLLPGVPAVKGFTPKVGDVLFVDQNNDGIIDVGKSTLEDPGDLKVIGNNQRRLFYAINGGLSWKGIDFSFVLTGVGRRQYWMSNEMVFPMYTAFSTVMKHQTDYWTPENNDAFYPRMYEKAAGNTAANRSIQSRYLLDGSFFSIKNLSLAYTFPKNLIQKAYISGLTIFLSAENVYTFYKTPKGINPESVIQEKGWFYPEMRKVSFGINLTL